MQPRFILTRPKPKKNSGPKTLGQNKFWYKINFGTKHSFGNIFFVETKFLSDRIFVRPNFCRSKIFVGPKFCRTKFFSNKNLLDQIFCSDQAIFLDQTLPDTIRQHQTTEFETYSIDWTINRHDVVLVLHYTVKHNTPLEKGQELKNQNTNKIPNLNIYLTFLTDVHIKWSMNGKCW